MKLTILYESEGFFIDRVNIRGPIDGIVIITIIKNGIKKEYKYFDISPHFVEKFRNLITRGRAGNEQAKVKAGKEAGSRIKNIEDHLIK